jgi:hypothetical protein
MGRVPALENLLNALGKGSQVVQHVFHLCNRLPKRTTFTPLGGIAFFSEVSNVGFQQIDLLCDILLTTDAVQRVLSQLFVKEPYTVILAR